MGVIYYQVFEYADKDKKEKRRIYTFGDANAAHDMVELILKNDHNSIIIGVEEYEAPTKL